jgi:serine/threonine protein kinase
MSPEVINMESYTIKSEIWSLGVLLYQIFFDELPYGKPNSIYEYKQKLIKNPELKKIEIFDKKIVNNIFNELLLKMLSIDPELRPTTEYILIQTHCCIPFIDNDLKNYNDYEIIKKNSSKNYDKNEIGSLTSFINSPNLTAAKHPDITESNIYSSLAIFLELFLDIFLEPFL